MDIVQARIKALEMIISPNTKITKYKIEQAQMIQQYLMYGKIPEDASAKEEKWKWIASIINLGFKPTK